MKKTTFLTLLIAFVIAFTGCSDQPKTVSNSIHFTASKDTVIQEKVLDTAKRYSCDGRALKHPKLRGISYQSKKISLKIDTTLSDSSAINHGPKGIDEPRQPIVGGADASSSWNVPDWFKTLLWILLLLLLLALLIAAIATLYKAWEKHHNEITAYSSTETSGGANPSGAANTTGNAGAQQQNAAATGSENVELLKQLQTTGGKISRFADGSITMDIPDQSVDVTIIDITNIIIIEDKPDEKGEKKETNKKKD